MSFRTRLSILVAAAVAVSVVGASVALYFVVRSQMLHQVDATLVDRLSSLKQIVPPCLGGSSCTARVQQISPAISGCPVDVPANVPTPQPTPAASGGTTPPCSLGHGVLITNVPLPAPALGAAGGFTQFVDTEGHVGLVVGEQVSLPVSDAARSIAAGTPDTVFETATVGGTPVRIATAPAAPGVAVQVARPLDEVDTVLSRLRWILIGICVLGVGVAAVLGRLVARTTLRPVDRLIDTTERVAGTHDLRERIEEPGDGELGRLAHSFNRMLEALGESESMQRQLVADASHELRTPLSSLRTNIEVLARAPQLPPKERDQLLADVTGQLQRLSRLVANLIDLARGDAPTSLVRTDVRLDELTARAVDVARTHFPDVRFAIDARPTVVEGDPERLEGAVANLLDNAGKWSPSGGQVEVQVTQGEVSVRDHGPGIATEHIPQVFDRFWRAPQAREKPGSGLGLAIVRQVARSHGGDVDAGNARDGGALLRLRLPAVS